MTFRDPRRSFRLFMNIAAATLFGVAVTAIFVVALSVNAIISDLQPSLGLTVIWLAAIWALLSMVAAAWCRMQALRPDADPGAPSSDPSSIDVSAALLKGMETWGSDAEPSRSSIIS